MSTQFTPTDTADVVRRASRDDVRIMSARRSVWERTREIWRYRELLFSLIRKELKVKYKDSALGFAWSMLAPAFTLTLYYVVFQIILNNGIPLFAIYLMSGLLVFNFFTGALAGAAGSVVGNSTILKKVAFPREILPLAAVGAALFNFFLQTVVMVLALLLFRHTPSFEHLLLVPLALGVLILLASALGIFLAAVNVRFRDTQHLLELVLQGWFWATPIIYPVALVLGKINDRFDAGVASVVEAAYFFLNPVIPIVTVFQRAIYNLPEATGGDGTPVITTQSWAWYLGHLGGVALLALVLLYGAMAVFGRLEGDFAEEL